ncbi:hypothetical protein WJX73_008425 [Symbiochloris irregularis]|uniref:Uncharacterized protein n=1 Tax=Symbiochloris irregularis TaxID=706552 RepID=A0AAW1PYZ0_9CHLO
MRAPCKRPLSRPDPALASKLCPRSHVSGAVLRSEAHPVFGHASRGRQRSCSVMALPQPSPGQDGAEGGLEPPTELLHYSDLFLPLSASAADWRTFRAILLYNEQRLAANFEAAAKVEAHSSQVRRPDQWAHLLAEPEVGCLMVARYADTASDSEQGVVLLCSHGGEDGTGTSYGFYLNKPWRRRRASGCNIRDGLADAFRDRIVYQGGMVSNRHLHVVHTCRQVEGSQEILEGVYCGGLPHANALVKAGHVAVHRFKLMAGYMGWEPGQLSREVVSLIQGEEPVVALLLHEHESTVKGFCQF